MPWCDSRNTCDFVDGGAVSCLLSARTSFSPLSLDSSAGEKVYFFCYEETVEHVQKKKEVLQPPKADKAGFSIIGYFEIVLLHVNLKSTYAMAEGVPVECTGFPLSQTQRPNDKLAKDHRNTKSVWISQVFLLKLQTSCKCSCLAIERHFVSCRSSKIAVVYLSPTTCLMTNQWHVYFFIIFHQPLSSDSFICLFHQPLSSAIFPCSSL